VQPNSDVAVAQAGQVEGYLEPFLLWPILLGWRWLQAVRRWLQALRRVRQGFVVATQTVSVLLVALFRLPSFLVRSKLILQRRRRLPRRVSCASNNPCCVQRIQAYSSPQDFFCASLQLQLLVLLVLLSSSLCCERLFFHLLIFLLLRQFFFHCRHFFFFLFFTACFSLLFA